eukprot:8055354-Pyramimonas_sp.AAC.1
MNFQACRNLTRFNVASHSIEACINGSSSAALKSRSYLGLLCIGNAAARESAPLAPAMAPANVRTRWGAYSAAPMTATPRSADGARPGV